LAGAEECERYTEVFGVSKLLLFVKDFAKIAKPLYKMIRKEIK